MWHLKFECGLAGPLINSRPGALKAEGRPADVDREIYMMLQVGYKFVTCCIWHLKLVWLKGYPAANWHEQLNKQPVDSIAKPVSCLLLVCLL
jgi:hypothetical protein